MKSIKNALLAIAGLGIILTACDKKMDMPVYKSGTAVTLTSSATTVAPLPADSNNTALTLSWTDPKIATDSTNVKYVIEIDSAGKNFAHEATRIVMTSHSASFTGKDLNNILLANGYAFNVPVDMEIRVTSSYGNNNEQNVSNVVKVKMTPYKVPPKIALPTSMRLFLVGDASDGGWNNPVPVPSQEFARLDETTWAGIFHLTGGKQYLVLPVNGDWSHKYSVASNTVAGLSAGGDFGYDLSDNFPGPATDGWYRIELNFQTGKFAVTPYTGTLPTNLFIVGDATNGGWNNPVPVPDQQLTRVNSSEWQITLPLIGGKQYLLLPVNGDWSHKYAVASNTVTGLSAGGEFGYDLNDNFPGPSASGTYKIDVNYAAKTTATNSSGRFTVTQ